MPDLNFNIKLNSSGDWQAVKDGQKYIYQLNGALKGVASFVKSGALLGLGNQLTQALARLPLLAGQAVSAGVAFNANIEQQTLALKTLMGSMAGAQGRMRELVQFASTTPFQLPEVIQANRLLQTFGGSALATQDTLRLVGDAAAASGQGFADVAMWVGRLYAGLQNGQPIGEATLRLLEMGVISGETKAELEALATAGGGTEAAMQGLQMAFGHLGGAMQEQSQSFSGLMSTFRDTVDLIRAETFAPVFDAAKESLQSLLTTLQEGNTGSFQAFGVMLGDLVLQAVLLTRGLLAALPVIISLGSALAAVGLGMIAGHAASAVLAVKSLTTAFGGLGVAIRGLLASNPFGLVVTALTTIGALVWQWTAGQRAARREAEAYALETQWLTDSFAARLQQLDTEIAKKEYIAELQQKINDLEAKRSRSANEDARLAALRQQQEAARAQDPAQNARENEARRAQAEALKAQADNLALLRTPDDPAARLQGMRERLAGMPRLDVVELQAEAQNLAQADTIDKRLAPLREQLERLEAERDRLAVIPSTQMNRVQLGRDRATNAGAITRLQSDIDRQTADLSGQGLMTETERQGQQLFVAELIQQAADRKRLATEVAELEQQLDAQTATRRQALAQADAQALQLREQDLRSSFEARTVSAQTYFDQRLEILAAQQAAERQHIETTVSDEQLKTAQLTNLAEEYRQKRLGVQREVAEATKTRLGEEWRAHEAYYTERIRQIDGEMTALLAQNTPEAIEAATRLEAERKRLIEAAQEKAKELNDELRGQTFELPGQPGGGGEIDPVTGEPVSDPFGFDAVDAPGLPGDPTDQMSMWEAAKAGWEDYQSTIVSRARGIRDAMQDIGATLEGSISRGIQGLIEGTMTWGSALRNIGQSVVGSIIKSFADMAAQWLMSHVSMRGVSTAWSAFSKALRKADAADHVATESTKAAAAAPSATLTSISSFGAAAAIGIAALVAAFAVGKALGGFAGGGYTGDGGKYEPAGIVHRGEYVIPQEIVARAGVENIQAIVASIGSTHGLPGYADGGAVGSAMPPLLSGNFQPVGQSTQTRMGGSLEQHIHVTTGVQATVRNELLNLMPEIRRQAIEAVADANARGLDFYT